MTRLVSLLRLELTLQVRQRFLHAAVFSGVMWLALLLPLSRSLRATAEPYALQGDILIIGFFFIGGAVFLEKQERTLSALLSTPLRFREYLTAMIAVLAAVGAGGGVRGHRRPRAGLRPAAAAGRGRPGRHADAARGVCDLAAVRLHQRLVHARDHPPRGADLPVLHYAGVWPNPLLYLIPTQGSLMLLGAAFDQVSLEPWQVAYVLANPAVCIAGLSRLARTMFDRYVVTKAGGV